MGNTSKEDLHQTSQDQIQELEEMVHVYQRCVEVFANVLTTCLRPKQIHKNTNIIYCLMHKQREIHEAIQHRSLVHYDGLWYIKEIMKFMSQRIEAVEDELSVNKTVEVIERGVGAFLSSEAMARG